MKNGKFVISAAMASVALSSLLMVGCARTLSRTETTSVSSSGTVKTKENTVIQNPDGSITRIQEKSTSTPP